MRRRKLLFWAAAPAVFLLGCAGGPDVSNVQPSPGADPSASAPDAASSQDLIPAVAGLPSDPAGGTVHRITAGDVLDIEVFQAEELSSTERVNKAGAVVLPLIGAVPVAGLTTDEAEQRIAAAFAKDYLQNPQVNVFATEYADLEVSVGGEVEQPGVFPLSGQTTLLEGIALAGGTTRLAKEDEVVVFRRTPSSTGVNAYVVDLKRIQRGELADPLLAANDKVVVPKSGTRVFLRDVSDTLRGVVSLNPLLY